MDVVFRDTSRFWVHTFLVPVVVFIGVLGNMQTIFIFNRSQVPASTSYRYLTSMAAADTVFLLSSLSLSLKYAKVMQTWKLYWEYVPFGLWLTDGFGSASVWIMTCYSVQRCFVVCRPLAYHDGSGSHRRAGLIVMSAWFACMLATSPTAFEWSVVEVTTGNATTYNIELSSVGADLDYKQVFYCFSAISFVFIPLTTISIANVVLMRALNKAKAMRDHLCCHKTATSLNCFGCEWKVTYTLMLDICAFLFCQIPTALVLLYTSIHTPAKGSFEENILLGIGNICNFLVTLNSAGNVFLYAFASDTFRRELSTILLWYPLSRGEYGWENTIQFEIRPPGQTV